MKPVSTLLHALGISVLTACAGTAPPNDVRREPITDELGHVIGHKSLVSDPENGEKVQVSTYYLPRYDNKGNVVGYDEPVPEGVVIRSLEGRRIGVRRHDLRSRAQNPSNEGVSIIVAPERRIE